jgi:cytochrome c-type biogenesis protein CcmH/NrfF
MGRRLSLRGTTLRGIALRGVALAFALWVVTATAASGQGLADDASGSGASGPPAWAYQMAHDLMSPFCPGRTLAACPSPQADQLRQWILFQAAAGQSQEELEATLFERFGDVLLSAPKAEGGWGISAYAIPIGGFLLGGPLVAFVIFRMARGRGATPRPGMPVTGSTAGGAPEDGAAPARTGPAPSEAELERMVREEFARS